jgi:hypothetical protein
VDATAGAGRTGAELRPQAEAPALEAFHFLDETPSSRAKKNTNCASSM